MTDYNCQSCKFLEDRSKENFIDGYCKKYQQSLDFYDWFEKCDKCVIETLQEENAELRARLDNALEFPRMEISPYDENDTLLYYIESGHIQQECFNNKFPEQLQKRLAELKGEK